MLKNRYIDLIEQTFYFPRHGFELRDYQLYFHDINLMEMIAKYGTPLKFTYLPKISSQIQKAKHLFQQAMEKHHYQGKYSYCYCTKSSHFSFVLREALNNDIDIETSSAFDMDIVERLHHEGRFPADRFIICNGYKTEQYAQNMAKLVDNGFKNLICVLDNPEEIDLIDAHTTGEMKLGIRVATEEEPNFLVYQQAGNQRQSYY